ncbi:I78 family peptidase inhibitor [Pseudomonas sp.]|uniref:I78 family peptidase inhibitor n=1 Tax=Pseudomonas sp. TaxID=306 RepID=UPI003D6F955B
MFRASLMSLLAVTVLAGCSSTGGSSSKAPEAGAANNDGRCQASGAEFAVGKQATPVLIEQARKASGSQLAHALGPHDAMTMDYRSERLNLHTDAQGVVVRVNCG